MAITPAKLRALKTKQEQQITIPTGEVTFLDSIELSAQSESLSGLVKVLPGKTKNGNWRCILTTDQGHFKFFAKEELEDGGVIENHSFGIQKLDDGKELYWY
jgi:hypothetical protein